ncbi:hypothetical protein [Rhodanobacter soli]|uniref:Uncharacterized protein n=1 Tax=Rhodanobacter soli TaxID=590609 RepID=A0ABV2PZ06_9GAMM
MEFLGLALAILGLLFAFEVPRNTFLEAVGLRNRTSPSWLSRTVYRIPRRSITSSSVILYLRTSPTSLRLDQQIASDQKATLKHFSGDGKWLVEKIIALGISDTQTLDGVVKKNSNYSRLLAHAFEQERTATQGDGISHALEIEAMERFGSEWYKKYLSTLQLTSTGPGYAADILEFYKTIKGVSP